MNDAKSNFTDFDAMTLKEKVRELNLDPNTMNFIQFMCTFCTVRYEYLKKKPVKKAEIRGLRTNIPTKLKLCAILKGFSTNS